MSPAPPFVGVSLASALILLSSIAAPGLATRSGHSDRAGSIGTERVVRGGPPRVIGLTGGISSGKSTASRLLGDLGAAVVDADRLGWAAYAKGSEGFRSVVAAFGQLGAESGLGPLVSEASGEVDRRVLAGLVFDEAHPERLQQLNGILWPIIKESIRSEVQRLMDDGASVIAIEAAVLLEAEWTDIMDEVWAVEVEESTALRRLLERSAKMGKPMTRGEAEKRMNKQMLDGRFRWRSLDPRVSVALSNEGSPDDLRLEVSAACLRRRLPLPSCTFGAGGADGPGGILAVPLGAEGEEALAAAASCVGPGGDLVALTAGDLGPASGLDSALGRMYAAATTSACTEGRMDMKVDILLDYLQDPKEVAWIAQLLRSGRRHLTRSNCPGLKPLFAAARPEAAMASPPNGLAELMRRHVAVGGTFDHLHSGHKALLSMTAILASEEVSVGVTSDSMAAKDTKKKCGNKLMPSSARQASVRSFLAALAPRLRLGVAAIDDAWGMTRTDASVDALVASAEFPPEKLSAAADRMRAEVGFQPMRLHSVPLVGIRCPAAGGGGKFGSSALRAWLYEGAGGCA